MLHRQVSTVAQNGQTKHWLWRHCFVNPAPRGKEEAQKHFVFCTILIKAGDSKSAGLHADAGAASLGQPAGDVMASLLTVIS